MSTTKTMPTADDQARALATFKNCSIEEIESVEALGVWGESFKTPDDHIYLVVTEGEANLEFEQDLEDRFDDLLWEVPEEIRWAVDKGVWIGGNLLDLERRVYFLAYDGKEHKVDNFLIYRTT